MDKTFNIINAKIKGTAISPSHNLVSPLNHVSTFDCVSSVYCVASFILLTVFPHLTV